MAESPIVFLEFFAAFGVPLSWGVWELISLRREQARDRARESERAAAEARHDKSTQA